MSASGTPTDRFEKVVLYTMLFEVVGWAVGSAAQQPVLPAMGSALYWLRPKTIRLPPWPTRIPLTKGTSRTPFDVLLYARCLIAIVVALFSDAAARSRS